MNKPLTASVIVGFVAFYLGGVIGFQSGFVRGAAMGGTTGNMFTISALRMFRQGNSPKAVDLLESHLDFNLTAAMVVAQHPSWLDPLKICRPGPDAMKLYARYRHDHPSRRVEDKALIEKAIALYAKD